MDPLLFVTMLALFSLWFAAAIVLRVLSTNVSEYYSGQRAPALAGLVRRTALGIVGIGLPIAVILGIPYSLAGQLLGPPVAVPPPPGSWGSLDQMVLPAVVVIVAVHLAVIAFFLWRWSLLLLRPHCAISSSDSFSDIYLLAAFAGPWPLAFGPIRTPERGAVGAWALSWWMFASGVVLSGVGMAFHFVASLSFFAWAIILAIAVLFELLSGYYRRVSQRHCTLWQIYLAIRSRRPLVPEMEFLADYSTGRQRQRLCAMCDELGEGVDPEDVFAHSAMLSPLEGAHLATGLRGRQLPHVLNDILQRRAGLSYDLRQAQNPLISVLYLWVVVLVLHAIVGFISYWIAPKFKKIFEDFGTELPGMTRMIVESTDAFANYWYLAVPFVFVALLALTGLTLLPFASGLSSLRERLTWYWPRICLPDVLRALAVATRAELPMEEAFVPLVRRQLRVPLHNRLVRIQEVVREGGDCWIGMADEKLLVPSEAQFLRSAQRTGNLPWALETLSTRFEQRWRFWVMFWFEFLQPVMVLFVGFVVGFVAMAYFLPLVKLINDLA